MNSPETTTGQGTRRATALVNTLHSVGDEAFRRLVESVKDYAIFLLTPDGHIATWNEGAARIKGYQADEIVGKHFSVFYTLDAVATGWPQEELRRALALGRFEDEGWRVRRDGTQFWANVIISPVKDGSGRVIGFSKVTRDLTQRLRAEAAELEGRRLSQFLAVLSHELRNPMGAMQNAVGVLATKPQDEQGRWCVTLLDRQLHHLSHIVDDLLDASRVSAGKLRLNVGRVDLNEVVQNAVEAVKPNLERHRHALGIRVPAKPTVVSGDTTRLVQVVVNLLNNAVKYTPEGGRLEVVVERGSSHANITVRDDGIGMTEALLKTVFEPFVQGESAQDKSEGGLGLGLTLVRAIVSLHGGSVAASSSGAGQGTTVRVSLPASQVPADSGLAVQEHRGTTPTRIMVVDDIADAADSLAMLLRLDGHEVGVAYDGYSAIELAKTFKPVVVACDLGLPDVSGFDVARTLRQLPEAKGTKLVSLSGFGQEADVQASSEAGFDYHLTKPVDVSVLSRVIAGFQQA